MSSTVIDRDLVRRVAEAAHIKLTDEELDKYAHQMKAIVEAFTELDQVDTEGVEPSFHPIELENVLREDEPRDWAWNPLGNTVHKENKYFKGPRIT
ncbi:MAG: Asp-tRNA(Asn)/Glu-tRNA(Gln) amidotransferase subunit GatC [Candidatus Bathyarchaeota archaeon]|nr:Asp-tRNA(Asn)/Glu-tRNA(Gln) amidotransferase subunit GatC [Candidatus Bathyarchaeota archaeon]